MIDNISLDFSVLQNSYRIPVKKIIEQYEKFPRRRKETKQLHGFNTSPDKDRSSQNFYVMTDYKAGTELIQMPDGSFKRKPKYNLLFDSMDGAFQLAKVQRQVFSGLNHNRRDILVVDIDTSYTACFTEAERQQRIITIKSLCQSLGVFSPNYIEFHKDSGHCQMGWYLTEYFINYRENKYTASLYRYICRVMAKLLNADGAFTGGNIKNPYNENNIAYFFDKEPRNTVDFISQIKKAAVDFKIDIPFPKEDQKVEKEKIKEIAVEELEHEGIDDSIPLDDCTRFLENGSRNCYAFGHTRTWVFRYMRNHNGILPSEESVISIFTEFEYRGAKLLRKDSIEPSANIKTSALSVLAFCKASYKEEIAEQIRMAILNPEVREERRQSSIITRQAEKSLRVLKALVLFSKGNTQKQIAKELGCTQPTVHNLLKYSIDDAIEELKKYLKFHKGSTIKKVRVLSDKIWEELRFWGFTEKDVYEDCAENIKEQSAEKTPVLFPIVILEDFSNKNLFSYKSRGDPKVALYY